MTTQRVTIRRKYDIDFDGTLARFIEVANDLLLDATGMELDSYDAGDAAGAILQIAETRMMENDDYIWEYRADDILITVIYEDELFVWTPELEN